MAHPVKCTICKEVFDRDKIECVETAPRRYAHLSCVDKLEEQQKKDIKDKAELEAYVKKIFHLDYIPSKIEKQIQSYVKKYHFTYSGIHGALVYFFEVKHNSIEKAKGTLGIE